MNQINNIRLIKKHKQRFQPNVNVAERKVTKFDQFIIVHYLFNDIHVFLLTFTIITL